MSARDGASGGPAPCGDTPRRRHNLEKAQQPPRARAQMAMENGEREMAGEHVEDLQIRGEPIGPSGAFLHTPHFRPPGDLRGLQEPARARGPRGSQGTLVSCVQFQKNILVNEEIHTENANVSRKGDFSKAPGRIY